jgi:drug/metabolite transporter (DMT)-like permease
MWLGFALASCVCWAVVFVLDSHLVGQVFDRPWVGVVVSAAFVAAILPFLTAGLLVTGVAPVGAGTILLALLTGALFAATQAAHFQALRYGESGIVAAYWGMVPVFVAAGGYAWLGERLPGRAYAGTAVLVVASVVFCLLDSNLKARWISFWTALAGCLFQAGYYLAVKVVFKGCPVYQGVLLILAGMAAAGLAPLVFRSARRVVGGNWPRLRPALRLIVVIELFHLLAVLAGQLAVNAGSPSLVAAAEATIPAFTFLLSLVLFARTGRYGEAEAGRRMPAKLTLVAVMTLGVWLVT